MYVGHGNVATNYMINPFVNGLRLVNKNNNNSIPVRGSVEGGVHRPPGPGSDTASPRRCVQEVRNLVLLRTRCISRNFYNAIERK